MKMSPCKSFRSFVQYLAVLLLIINTINAFAIKKVFNTTHDTLQDLSVAESLQLEVRHDLKRLNGISVNISNKSNELLTTATNKNLKDVEVSTTAKLFEVTYHPTDELKEHVIDNVSGVTSDDILNSSVDSSVYQEFTENLNNDKTTEYMFLPSKKSKSVSQMKEIATYKTISFDVHDYKKSSVSDDIKIKTNIKQLKNVAASSETENASELPRSITTENHNTDTVLPYWKRYAVIERKKATTTTESPATTIIAEGEEMVKAETRVTLKDSITSDAVEQIKKDKLISTEAISASKYLSSTLNYQNIPVTQKLNILTKSDEESTQKFKIESVSSKRGGFLNFSLKSKQLEEVTTNMIYFTDSIINSDYTTPILDTFQGEHTDTNIVGSGLETQSYLKEDAIKEELLHETPLSNKEEIVEQHREEGFNNTDTIFSTLESYNSDTTQSTRNLEWTTQVDITSTDNKLNVKPIQDKGKSTILYTVNPNYKPMKKIEVQPPKPFVRDPDDNSWRNESISSMGIVFKPKNSSKPFTQVLKNKTETEWSNILSKNSKIDVPDLRERLEKMAQKRKSKKKKANLFGNIAIYTDYEESNSSEEITSTTKAHFTTTESMSEITTIAQLQEVESDALFTPSISTLPVVSTTITSTITTDTTIQSNAATTVTTPTIPSEVSNKKYSTTKETYTHKKGKYEPVTTGKGKKYFNIIDYYDISDDDDNEPEYLELAKLELKKFTVPLHMTNTPFATSPPLPYQFTKALNQYMPERKPTLQYFPPLDVHKTKSDRFVSEFERKYKSNMEKTPSPKDALYVTSTKETNTLQDKYYSRYNEERNILKSSHNLLPLELPSMYKSNALNKNIYHTESPRITTTEQNRVYGVSYNNEGLNRASYVIRNYKDVLEQAAKDYDYDRDVDYIPYTETPLRGITISDLIAQTKDKVKMNVNENYDYDAKFRKDVLERFVDNFNHNEARYNANFPVLYNNSVVHVNTAEHGKAIASSRSFLKGIYNPTDTESGYAHRQPYDPNCDNITVELSPAYELHYYVPDQEEKEEMEPKPVK